MADIKSANVNKKDTGGGDNYVSDGYIQSVQKVWVDSASMGSTALGSDDTICIGFVPGNKKINEVEVWLPALNPTATTASVYLDTGTTILYTAANTYLGAMQGWHVAEGTEVVSTAALQKYRLQTDKQGTVTPSGSGVYLYIAVVMDGGGDAINTGGTIRSIIRYT
jgi:hypothetical protein